MNALTPLILLTLTTGAIEIEAVPLRGEPLIGDLVELTNDHLRIATEDGEQQLASRELLRITPLASTDVEDLDDLPPDRITVSLIDGSTIHVDSYRVEDGRAWIRIDGEEETRLSTRSIHSVRLKQGGEDVAAQWDEIAARERAGDVLVLRKTRTDPATERVAIALDQLEGVMHAITADTVGFEFENTRADVPRERVEGVIYFHRRTTRPREPICQVIDLNGSRWSVRSLKMAEDRVELLTTAGVRYKLAFDMIERVDYSGANLVYLSDLEPESVKHNLYVQTATTPQTARNYFRPQRDRSFYGKPLLIDGNAYEKGLALHSRTVMSYRLTSDYRRLLATVGIDDRCRVGGNVELTVVGNGKQLFQRHVSSHDKPISLDLDVEGVRRLELEVDFGPDGVSVGDNLNLGDIRLTR